MKVWVLGQTGFIGRRVAQALAEAGHEVVERARVDMARCTRVEHWIEGLRGVEAVVNAVGVLRDSRQRPIWPTHALGPQALFDACVDSGVQHVVQVSALGVAQSETDYARSKRCADEPLLALAQQGHVCATVLRPSVVVGQGGASTALFLMLARWPLLWMPAPVAQGLAQPLWVGDLAQAVLACLPRPQVPPSAQPDHAGAAPTASKALLPRVLELAGPEVFTLADLIAQWRQALGRGPARVLRMPTSLSAWSARLGDQLPFSPWCSESLALLSTPNTSSRGDLAALLGRAPVSVRDWPKGVWV